MNSAGPILKRRAAKDGQIRVVVTGMGTVNPIGKNLEEYWHGLIEGRSGASPIERFRSDRLATSFPCQGNTLALQDHMELNPPWRWPCSSQWPLAGSAMRLAVSGIN